MQTFDAIIIGSGQAGNPLAHNLADKEWEVALIEREHLGGSCINYGCTPTKTMLASARIAHYVRRAHEFGIEAGDPVINLDNVVGRKNRIVRQWRSGQQQHVDERPTLTLFRGEAQFIDSHVIRVNGDELTADRIFINTGTRPRVLPIDGLDTVPYLTNKTIMELPNVPDHLLVIGGSYIGLEFGQMYRRFGSKVTVVEFADQLVPREDEDIATTLQDALKEERMTFLLATQAVDVEQDDDGQIQLTVESRSSGRRRTLTGSHLLLAAGRVPNSDALNLDAAGIEHENGWISVDEHLETNVPGVYALGDVKGGPAFTHISYNDFQIVYHNLFNEDKRSTEDRLVPYALYTDPELGRVGLTEKEAREQGYNVKVGSIPMEWVARAIERNETAGMMKVVVDAETDRILGAAILSIEGGELVQTLMTLMMVDAPWTTFQKAMFIHPTLTEGFFTLMDNVE